MVKTEPTAEEPKRLGRGKHKPKGVRPPELEGKRTGRPPGWKKAIQLLSDMRWVYRNKTDRTEGDVMLRAWMQGNPKAFLNQLAGLEREHAKRQAMQEAKELELAKAFGMAEDGEESTFRELLTEEWHRVRRLFAAEGTEGKPAVPGVAAPAVQAGQEVGQGRKEEV